MDIEQQKEVAKSVLEDIELLCSDVWLVGGAPRNWFLGHTAKDLDIFIRPKNVLEPDQAISLLSSVGMDNPVIAGASGYAGGEFYVINTEREGIKVQCMFPTISSFDCEEYLETFDVDISMCAAYYENGEYKFFPTPEFKKAVETKTVTVLREPETKADFRYLKKIRGYCDRWGFTFVCPFELEEKVKIKYPSVEAIKALMKNQTTFGTAFFTDTLLAPGTVTFIDNVE